MLVSWTAVASPGGANTADLAESGAKEIKVPRGQTAVVCGVAMSGLFALEKAFEDIYLYR